VRRHGRAYLQGLLSGSERKNSSSSLAELAGKATPDGLQRPRQMLHTLVPLPVLQVPLTAAAE
jgi:hypothetical protein